MKRKGINCLPFKETGLLHHCVGCDRLTIFDSDYHCWFCGCDPPSGVGTDPDENRDNWADWIVIYKVTFKGIVIIKYLFINDHMKGEYRVTNPFWPEDPEPFDTKKIPGY